MQNSIGRRNIMGQRQKRESTQWTAQFLAAAELCRRGYVVTFTMGNCTQDYDLLVGSQDGEAFYVDVKGLSSNKDWLIRRKATIPNLYYILIRIDIKNRSGDRFFIMTQEDVINELDHYYSKPKKDGSPKSGHAEGFSFKQADTYSDKWDKLPHSN